MLGALVAHPERRRARARRNLGNPRRRPTVWQHLVGRSVGKVPNPDPSEYDESMSVALRVVTSIVLGLSDGEAAAVPRSLGRSPDGWER